MAPRDVRNTEYCSTSRITLIVRWSGLPVKPRLGGASCCIASVGEAVSGLSVPSGAASSVGPCRRFRAGGSGTPAPYTRNGRQLRVTVACDQSRLAHRPSCAGSRRASPSRTAGAAAVTQRPADHACTAAGRRGIAGPVGPVGSGTPDPYRGDGACLRAAVTCDRSRSAQHPRPCRGEACLARLHQKARHQPRVIAGPLGRRGRAYPTPTCGTRGRGMGVLTVLPRLCRAERQIGTGFAGPLGPDGSGTPDPAGQAPVTPTGGTGGTAAATVTGRRSRSAHRPLSCRGEACLAQPHRRRGILRSRCRLSRPDVSGTA